MSNNILEKTTAEKLIVRVQSLKAESVAKWGVMNATEMLLHVNLCNNQILDGNIEYKKSTLKQKLLRIIGLYVAPNFPKNLPTEPRNDTKGLINDKQFESEKKKLINTIEKFAARKEPIELTHPAFGNLNTTQWGIAAYKHTDHHLRQFGV